jgi:hypothetical protein
MPRLLDRAVRIGFALVVAGGLGFGTRSAVASTRQRQCSDNEPYISCSTTAECGELCKQYYGPTATGSCFRGCCLCNV